MRGSLALALALAATPVAAQGWDEALRPTAVGQGRATLAERMVHWHVPGVSVAVVDACRIVDARGFGTATATGAPVGPATLFQAASISKTVAAFAALQLVEDGRLALDADVRTELSGWTLPGTAPVTLRALLGHRAGVGVPSFPGYAPGAPLPTAAQVLDGAAPANTPPVRVAAPAGVWRYSGGGYQIVQALIEDAGGEPFATTVARTVLAPAGMADSAFDQPPAPERATRAATGFDAGGAPLPGGWRVFPELAAAGLWTTPSDLARFAVALARSAQREGGLLSPERARAMLTRGPGDWGLGVALGPPGAAPYFGHEGSNAGFTSAFVLYPGRCAGAAVMTNGESRELVSEVLRAIGEAYAWPGRAISPASNRRAAPAAWRPSPPPPRASPRQRRGGRRAAPGGR